MSLYDKIAKNQTCVNMVRAVRAKRKEKNKKKRVKGKYTFINRKKNSDKLCIILAGTNNFYGKMYLEELENMLQKIWIYV